MSRCWICGGNYVTDYCTACGPPEAWGPTAEELKGFGAADKSAWDPPSSAARPSVREAHTQPHATAPPVCRHGVPLSVPCDKCELEMMSDVIDDMVSVDEIKRRWREP